MDSLFAQAKEIKEQQETKSSVSGIDLKKIRRALEQWIDFSAPVIEEAVIQKFVRQVVVVDDHTTNWTLDLTPELPGKERAMKPSQIALQLYREKRAQKAAPETKVDSILSRHITDPTTILTLQVTKADAEAYCHSIGMKFFAKKWRDQTILVSI